MVWRKRGIQFLLNTFEDPWVSLLGGNGTSNNCPLREYHILSYLICFTINISLPPFNTSYQQLLWSLVARTSDLPSDLLKLQSIGKPHLAHGFVYFDKVVNKVHPGFPDLLESSRMGRWWVRREWRQHWRNVSRKTHSKYEITFFAVDSFHFNKTSLLSTVHGCVCVCVCVCAHVYVCICFKPNVKNIHQMI